MQLFMWGLIEKEMAMNPSLGLNVIVVSSPTYG